MRLLKIIWQNQGWFCKDYSDGSGNKYPLGRIVRRQGNQFKDFFYNPGRNLQEDELKQ